MAIEVFEDRLFCLSTQKSSYILTLTEGLLTCAHWGGRVLRCEDFLTPGGALERYNNPEPTKEECSAFGTMHFKESSLKVRFADGTRDFRYRLAEWDNKENTLSIKLQDIHYPLTVTLFYRVHEKENIIEKWRTVQWEGEDNAVVERLYSGEFSLPGRGYQSLNYRGHWGAEFGAHSEQVDSGKKVYESIHGLTAHGCSPFFAVHKGASEERGEVYFGALGYSGNFKIVVEAAPKNYLSVLAGMSDTDFEIHLQKGQSFTTPPVYAGYTVEGLTGMTHTLTGFARAKLMPKHWGSRSLDILYNSWYATYFDVFCDEQIALARRAADLGVELFVVDDGWFLGRNNDHAGLGDWTPDPKKFPDGLTPLIQSVNQMGMRFGIWIEPEMVNPDSNLFRAHPQWVLRYKNREILTGRNQYLLDMANPEVQDYLFQCFDSLLRENNINYIKWDMNRFVAEMGSETRDPQRFKELWHQYTEGFYGLIKALRKNHPTVEFEACASGGGRVDFGALEWFDEYWPSDNVDPLDRLTLQRNYSYIYPIKYMRAFVADDDIDHRTLPLSFSMHSAMCGALAIGVDLNKKTPEEIEAMKPYIAAYKTIRDTVQLGDLYRLKNMPLDGLEAVEYSSENQAVVFLFRDHGTYGADVYRVRLRGLSPESLYTYHCETGDDKKKRTVTKSGAYLMEYGLGVRLEGDYASQMICLQRQLEKDC